MFKLLRRKTKHAGNNLLALDIGTEFVKALVVQMQGKGNGRVLGVGKSRQSLGEMQNGAVTDISAVIANCKEAIADAERMSSVVPDQLVMGIAGEMVKGSTRTIRYRRHDPHTKIHFEELKNIVHKVQWKAFEQIRSELAFETGYNEIDVKLVSAAIVDVQVDGYKVANPIGFQGNEVVLTIFNAFAPLVHYGALQTIAAELDVPLLAITSEPYAVSRCMESANKDQGLNALFIDIGGGTTDISVVRNNGLEGTKVFTIGGRSFTKRLSQNLNVSFSEAEEIKLAYAGNRLEKQSHKIVQKALQSDCDVWLTGIGLTLGEFTHVDMLPSSILLCGGGSHLPEMKNILSERDWWKSLPFARKPHVRFLHPKDLPHIQDSTNRLHDPQDITPLALASLGLELASEEKVLSKILRKVVRLMQV
jgi:cell division protein FtsA